MEVLVEYQVTPPDVEKFLAAAKRFAPLIEAEGGTPKGVYRLEGDPTRVAVFEGWASHDAMHAASDKLGDDFNREAGTEGVDWVTNVWSPAG